MALKKTFPGETDKRDTKDVKKDKKEKKDDGVGHTSAVQANPGQLRKLQEIERQLAEIQLDHQLKQKALDKIAEARTLLTSTVTSQRDQVLGKLRELDDIILDLREKAVQAKKDKIYDGVQSVLGRGENIQDLASKADALDEIAHTAFQPRHKAQPKKQGGGFLSFFSCFGCCAGKDDNDKNHERSPLLRRK